MPIVSNDENRLSAALDTAEDMFWNSIASDYPEAKSGDLSPACSIALATAQRAAVVEWLELNVDSPPQTATIMLHRIEYYYRDEPEMGLDDSEREHIAYCISEGISEGDLCTMPDGYITEVRGYWKINNSVV